MTHRFLQMKRRRAPAKAKAIINGDPTRSRHAAHHDLVVLRGDDSGESAPFTVSLFFGTPDYTTLRTLATMRGLLPPCEVGGYTGRSFILKDGPEAPDATTPTWAQFYRAPNDEESAA